jgi:hypothetical protein
MRKGSTEIEKSATTDMPFSSPWALSCGTDFFYNSHKDVIYRNDCINSTRTVNNATQFWAESECSWSCFLCREHFVGVVTCHANPSCMIRREAFFVNVLRILRRFLRAGVRPHGLQQFFVSQVPAPNSSIHHSCVRWRALLACRALIIIQYLTVIDRSVACVEKDGSIGGTSR